MPIAPIPPVPPVAPSVASTGPSLNVVRPSDGEAFAASLAKLVGSVDEASANANVAIGNMLDGTGDVHEAMIAIQRAETALELTVQVRNKLVQAYQDIMRMPV